MFSSAKRERQNLESLIELIEVLPFDMRAARAYSSVRYATRHKRSDHLDKLIAAHAIAVGAILITNNERDFLEITQV